MGCCLSIQHEEEEDRQNPEILVNKPKVTVTRASSSVQSNALEKGSSVNSSSIPPLTTRLDTGDKEEAEWPVFVRLSNNGQDIAMHVPTQAPYWNVSTLGKEVLPHLEKKSRVKFIYLGRVLPDTHLIVPICMDSDSTISKNNAIYIQKEGVIQAMVTHLSR
ncbi:uncharacterized protein EV154DRAFT_523619 [Mucor mucedo]|uniref:uncharacterized protein n=1 Tax=Mucor mucedo TaxID=29922 RepID=UPI00222031B8|nr:uncharacterized protein EV154DRAFT_523619 [Mucor mucedo]KAI7881232.1 hypothetical protein EV154DRAFT_523619 [Mucor mucedo]